MAIGATCLTAWMKQIGNKWGLLQEWLLFAFNVGLWELWKSQLCLFIFGLFPPQCISELWWWRSGPKFSPLKKTLSWRIWTNSFQVQSSSQSEVTICPHYLLITLYRYIKYNQRTPFFSRFYLCLIWQPMPGLASGWNPRSHPHIFLRFLWASQCRVSGLVVPRAADIPGLCS